MRPILLIVLSLFHLIGFVISSIPANAHRSNIEIRAAAAQPGQFPFVGSIPFQQQACYGTLINPSYFLTSAHCVNYYNSSSIKDLSVTLNTTYPWSQKPGSIVVGLSSFILHEGFKITGTGYVNDVALLVLSQPVTTVNPVQFPRDLPTTTQAKTTTKTPTKPTTKTTKATTKSTTTTTKKTTPKPTTTTTKKPTTKPTTAKTLKTTKKQATTKIPALRDFSTYANKDALIVGLDAQMTGTFNFEFVMTVTNVTIFDNNVCTSKWGTTQFDGNSMMCANGKGSSLNCRHDEAGGPILVDGVQVGIASFPTMANGNCNDPNIPPIFTRMTAAYLNWIDKTIVANPPPAL